MEIFSCFFGKFQLLLVIYTNNLLSSPDDARLRDRGLFGLDKTGLDLFLACHAFNLFPEKVVADSPAQRCLPTKTRDVVGHV